jgi:hypothetical protein
MCHHLVTNITKFSIYRQYDSSNVLKNLYTQVDRDEVEFVKDLRDEDIETMNRLNWLKKDSTTLESFAAMFSYYNELARKFLLEGRFDSAH